MKTSLLLFSLLIFISSMSMAQDKFKTLEEKYNFEPVIDYSLFSGSEDIVAPKYIDGKAGLDLFLKKNIIYPAKAKSERIEGVVVAFYYIDVEGNITGIQLQSNTPEILNKEFIRVLKNSGPWIPATKNGKYLKMKVSVSFEFKLE